MRQPAATQLRLAGVSGSVGQECFHRTHGPKIIGIEIIEWNLYMVAGLQKEDQAKQAHGINDSGLDQIGVVVKTPAIKQFLADEVANRSHISREHGPPPFLTGRRLGREQNRFSGWRAAHAAGAWPRDRRFSR